MEFITQSAVKIYYEFLHLRSFICWGTPKNMDIAEWNSNMHRILSRLSPLSRRVRTNSAKMHHACKAWCIQPVCNRNRQLFICVENISLFSLERGGLPTGRPAKPLRLDDVEGGGSGDRELVHILHHQRQQLCAALDLDGLCNRFLIVGQDRKQRILRAGNRHVRIIRQ